MGSFSPSVSVAPGVTPCRFPRNLSAEVNVLLSECVSLYILSTLFGYFPSTPPVSASKAKTSPIGLQAWSRPLAGW